MSIPYNLVLIGGRGSGKSSLARRILRKRKELAYFSLDPLIRYEADGRTIPEIVEAQGWRGFRELENLTVQKVSHFPGGALIDCGGGVVVDLDDAGNEVYSARKVDALRHHGLVIYLYRPTLYLLSRVEGDTNRPSLSATRSFEEIMARRDPWYRQAAHHTLDCGTRKKSELVDEILAWFDARCIEAAS